MEEIHDKKPRSTNKRRMRAKLIFNPGSAGGRRVARAAHGCDQRDAGLEACAGSLPGRTGLQPARGGPRCPRAEDPYVHGMRGGDGTISAVARTLAGTRATLGIIPTGTQNNVALSLEIPADIPAAIAITGGMD